MFAAGEIVGIAGVAGNGQSQLLETIAGIRQAESGTVLLNGKPIDVTGTADPGDLRDRGLAHVPEDRHYVGLVLPSRKTRTPCSATTTGNSI
jgi:general nucleoside transport system ATP-binding protein